MARYQRGQVCGVDNCPSRLWKRVDGRNVCQYGHINEFDIEINDEEEVFGSAAGGGGTGEYSKRLTNVDGLTMSQNLRDRYTQITVDKAAIRKYGDDFKLLQIQCFQIILCKNTKFVIQELQMTSSNADYYKKIVKGLWIKLLKMSVNKELDTNSKKYDIGHLVVINYLAIVEMNLPVSLDDFIRITYKRKFNIERSEYCLPRSLRIQIPISKLSSFHGHLDYDYMYRLRGRFCTSYVESNLSDKSLNYFPILVRKLIQRQLPLEIATLVKNHIDSNQIDLTFSTLLQKYQHHLEHILETIINKISGSYIESPEHHTKTVIDIPETQFVNIKKQMTYKTQFADLMQWSDAQIIEYADYYAENVLPNIHNTNVASSNEYKDSISLQIAQALLDCFPDPLH